MTPDQLREALALTRMGYCNLKIVSDKWAGLRVESGKTWVYVGLTIDGAFDRVEAHEELHTALAALAAHNKLADQQDALEQVAHCWG